MLIRLWPLAGLLLAPLIHGSETWDATLDALGEKLTFSSADHFWKARISGTLDLEAYAFDSPTPGLIRTRRDHILQPRATLFLDAYAGSQVYGFIQARLDRGFDPTDRTVQARLDEFALRYTPWDDGRFNLQIGQFAMVAGQWVKRHLSWQNPFITAPLFYENRTWLSDREGPTRYHLSASYPTYEAPSANPVIWGPAYTTGIAATGHWRGRFEWAVELKNAAPFSRPSYWAWWDAGFSTPTFGGRLAWRPDLRWTFGLAASHGTFLSQSDLYQPPPGYSRDDFTQTLWILDASYAHRHWEIWMEAMTSLFKGPNMDRWRSDAYFIEIRRKVTPRLSLALRWNQQFFSSAENAYDSSDSKWGWELSRLDLATTWRFNAHTQLQIEVGQRWGVPGHGDPRLSLAGRLTLRF